nr:MAG TPA: hypothetical protein [Caudoviricetes sp.]
MVSKKIWLMLSPIGNYLLTIWQIISTSDCFWKWKRKGMCLGNWYKKACFHINNM